MSISVLTLLIVYLRYNALYIKLKLFALYNNIFFMKVSKTENRFSTTENRFSKKTVLTFLILRHSLYKMPWPLLRLSSLGAVESLENQRSGSRPRQLTDLMHVLDDYAVRKKSSPTIVWILGHLGIQGNKTADDLCKRALRHDAVDIPTTLEYSGSDLRGVGGSNPLLLFLTPLLLASGRPPGVGLTPSNSLPTVIER